jgi:hypothetical protein
MAKVFYVRYNQHGSQLETAITDGRTPIGVGWKRISLEDCCKIGALCAEKDRTFYTEAYTPATTFQLTLKNGGVNMYVSSNADDDVVVDTFNDVYLGIATFTKEDLGGGEYRIKVLFNDACGDFSIVGVAS